MDFVYYLENSDIFDTKCQNAYQVFVKFQLDQIERGNGNLLAVFRIAQRLLAVAVGMQVQVENLVNVVYGGDIRKPDSLLEGLTIIICLLEWTSLLSLAYLHCWKAY